MNRAQMDAWRRKAGVTVEESTWRDSRTDDVETYYIVREGDAGVRSFDDRDRAEQFADELALGILTNSLGL